MASALPPRTDIAAPSGSLHHLARRFDDLDLGRSSRIVHLARGVRYILRIRLLIQIMEFSIAPFPLLALAKLGALPADQKIAYGPVAMPFRR
jgi:hypothetical protein